MNLAEQLRQELNERARNAESSKYLMDYVMNQFRKRGSPVRIYIWSHIDLKDAKDLAERLGYGDSTDYTADLKYENGRHYARVRKTDPWVDISDMKYAQEYAVSKVDEADKTNFLQNEGFHVSPDWKYGLGHFLAVTY